MQYDGAALTGEYNAADALLRRYVHGPGVDEPLVWYEGTGTGDRRYFDADNLGSPVSLSGNSGAYAINFYDEYGVPGSGNTGRFGFTGQTWIPEAGLYYYKARMYNPKLGRFMQTDPILYDGGMNLYAYVGNDPVNWIDPLGLQSAPHPDGGGDTVGVTGHRELFPFLVYPNYLKPPRLAPNQAYQEDSFASVAEITGDSSGEGQVVVTGRARSRTMRAPPPGFVPAPGHADDATFEFLSWVLPELKLFGGAGKLCGCFIVGTEVSTPEGLRPIEEIKVGDRVVAYDEATGRTEPRAVTALIRPLPKAVLEVMLTDAGGEAERFVATADHPWLVARGEGRAEWVETIDLRPGDRLVTADGRGAVFTGAKLREGLAKTYNLEVEGLHTFLVGDDGVVVHNTDCAKILRAFERQLAQHGRASLQRSLRSIESRLVEHQAKLAQIRATGGHASSVEREIRTFQAQIAAIRILLGP